MECRIRKILVSLLLASLLLSGCKLGQPAKPTVVSLAKAAITNIGNVSSAEMNVSIDGDISATYEALGVSMNMGVDSDIQMEVTKDPERAKGTIDLTIGAIGQEQTIKGDFYNDIRETGRTTTYVRWADGDWMKQTTGGIKTDQQESAVDDDSEEAEDTESEEDEEKKDGKSGLSLPDSLVQSIAILKLLQDGSIDAELKEETVVVNAREAWQMNCSLSGKFVRQLMESGNLTLGGLSPDTAGINWDEVTVPAEIYIYKDTELPARITLECSSIGAQMVGKLFADALEHLPVAGIKLDVSSLTVDILIDRYDEIEAFEIPSEVSDAKETDSLLPTLPDIFKFW